MSKISIQEIATPCCASCASARKILEEEIKPRYPQVEIEYIDMLSEKGQTLVQKYGIMASPGIIVNGELFAVGGLNKARLMEKIASML